MPCHRTSYPNFIYGNINLEKEDFELIENNLQMCTTLYGINPNYSMPKCEQCILAPYCMKQCLGSQYESQGDLFESNPTVCDLYKTKLVTIYELFNRYSLFEQIISLPDSFIKSIALDFKEVIEKFLEEVTDYNE